MKLLSTILAVACILAAIALVIFAARRRRQARDRDLAALAAALHFTYTPRLAGASPMVVEVDKPFRSDAVGAFLAQFAGCPVFAHGTCRDVGNVLSSTRAEGEYLVFDYDYHSADSPDDPGVIRTTCVCIRPAAVDGRHLPSRRSGRLQLEPRIPVVSSLMSHAPGDPAVATGHGDFDDHFVVRAANAHEVQVLLTPAIRQYLLSLWHSPARWYRHCCIHDDLIIITEAGHAPAAHVKAMIQIAGQLLELVNQ